MEKLLNNELEQKVRLEDDFYEAVNAKWLETAKIPQDRGSTGAFYEIYIKNEKILMNDTKKLIESLKSKKINNSTLENYAEFSAMASNFAKREELGVKPLVPTLKRLLSVKSLDQLIEQYDYFFHRAIPLPFDFGVIQNFKDSEDQIIGFAGADLILPEKSYYDEKNPMKQVILDAYRKMAMKLLSYYYDDEKKNQKIVEETLEFDASLVEFSPSSLELADMVKLHNPYTLDMLKKCSSIIDFEAVLKKIVPNKELDIINVYYPKFVQNIDKIVNNETFKKLKSWMLLKTIVKFSYALNEDCRLIVSEFNRVISGQKKPSTKEKAAFNLAYKQFSIPVGTYYAEQHFGSKAKKDVEQMISKMIDVYKTRLFENDWLGKQTKIKAIEKLSALGVHVGYPNEIQPFYADYKIKNYAKGGDLISNIMAMNVVYSKWNMAQYKEPINKNYWGMSPAEVNAYFNPSMNHIVFPAGILKAPFYSIKQSESANYGGIGAVIAHEISHAFDNNGANFDEKGNLNSWWTEEDFKTFNEKAKSMIELFEGQKTEFGKCNGQLTVSENIADAGGISCALEAASFNPKCNYEDFFKNWAIVWRGKFKKQTAELLLASDVHAPQKLRANIQVKNLDKFYETFNIKSSDKMWLPKAKRVKIW
ncbi:M13-type metalloendopeptidase [Mycoplasmopsis felifaucium]|uniref:M13-type metalloendopeptidase n=1 Tax=Mycoplasmopsis felifaucium TaxID=35768 RepID=UPI00056D6116|nr:M13 family metallopeptidase [Mycoplasmopsis felifaucium]